MLFQFQLAVWQFMWTIIMHLRELRLLIQSRYLLSPALLSTHHIKPRIKSTYRQWSQNDQVFLVRSFFNRYTANWHVLNERRVFSAWIFFRFISLKTWFIIKRCLYFNLNDIHHTFIQPTCLFGKKKKQSLKSPLFSFWYPLGLP